MKEELSKMFERKQLVDLIYVSKSGEITKRRVKLISISSETFRGFCFFRNANRTFIIDNVLALIPVVFREREVI